MSTLTFQQAYEKFESLKEQKFIFSAYNINNCKIEEDIPLWRAILLLKDKDVIVIAEKSTREVYRFMNNDDIEVVIV